MGIFFPFVYPVKIAEVWSMKFRILLILLPVTISLSVNIFSQNQPDTLKGTFNGPYELKTEDGRILYKGTFAYGLRTGDWEIWDREHVFCQYKNGVLHGYYKEKKGDILDKEWSYVNGKRNGIQKEFHSNAKLQLEYSMVDDMLEGSYKEYGSDGKLKYDLQFKNGKRHGKSIRYREDGVKKYFEIEFKNGLANGLFIEYDHNGLVKSKGPMLHGKRDGNWEFYENGKPDETAVYKNGVVISGKDIK